MAQQSKKNITIIQLGRIGDILQTICAVSNPEDLDIDFTVVCRQSFGQPLKYLLEKYFKNIYFLDTDSLFSNSSSLHESSKRMDKVLASINQYKHDALVNLTFSKPAAYLMSLLESPIKIGQVFQGVQEFSMDDMWSRFVYSNIMTGPHSTFNLVDIMKRMIGIPFSLTQNSEPPSESKKEQQIIINPFASHRKKFWNTEKWAMLINILAKNSNYTIYLVGSPSEKAQGDKIISLIEKDISAKIKNLVGQTTIEQLSKHLREADLFLGHDSMTSHLAAIEGTQTLTLSLGTVRPAETMPYGENHFTLVPNISCFPCFPNDQCSNLECHDQINQQLVASLTDLILNNKNTPDLELNDELSDLFESSSLYRTHISDFTLKTQKLFPQVQTTKDILNTFYHQSWLFIFADQEEHLDFPALTKDLCKELTEQQIGFECLFELSGFGKKFSKTIADEAKQKKPRNEIIKEQSNKLKEIEDLTQSIRKQYPHLTPLINFTSLELKLNTGENLQELAENSLLAYHMLNLSIGIIYDFISKSIENFEGLHKAHLSR